MELVTDLPEKIAFKNINGKKEKESKYFKISAIPLPDSDFSYDWTCNHSFYPDDDPSAYAGRKWLA